MWITLKCIICAQLGRTAQHSKTKAAFVAWTNNGIAEIYTETGTFCLHQMTVSKVLILQVSFEHSAQWFQHSHWCELKYCITSFCVCAIFTFYDNATVKKTPSINHENVKWAIKSDAYSQKEKKKNNQGAVYPTVCNHMYCMLALLPNGKDSSYRPINEWHG